MSIPKLLIIAEEIKKEKNSHLSILSTVNWMLHFQDFAEQKLIKREWSTLPLQSNQLSNP